MILRPAGKTDSMVQAEPRLARLRHTETFHERSQPAWVKQFPPGTIVVVERESGTEAPYSARVTVRVLARIPYEAEDIAWIRELYEHYIYPLSPLELLAMEAS